MINGETIEDARELLAGYGEAGWLLRDSGQPEGVDNGPVIYLCDVSSGRVLLFITASGALKQLSENMDIEEQDYLDIRAALSVLVSELLDSSAALDPGTRRGLILGAAFCICKTRGFHITSHHGNGVQYLLVRYRDAATGNHVLTPLPVFKSHPLAATDLEASVMHVLASEQVSHPERFAGLRSAQFRQARRSVVAGR